MRRLAADRYRDDLKRWADETRLPLRDFGDRLLTPAFVNAHTHLALGFLRGAAPPEALRGNMVREFYFGIERNLEPEDVAAFTRMGAYESLLVGRGPGVGSLLPRRGGRRGARRDRACGRGGAHAPGPVGARSAVARGPDPRHRDHRPIARAARARRRRRGRTARHRHRERGPVARELRSGALAGAAAARPPGAVARGALVLDRAARRAAARWLASLGVLEGVPATAFAHAHLRLAAGARAARREARPSRLLSMLAARVRLPGRPHHLGGSGPALGSRHRLLAVERLDERAEGAPARRGSAHDGRHVVARLP